MADACKSCKKEKGDVAVVTPYPGVSAKLCTSCKGQCEADEIANLKAYGFKAAPDAAERFDEIKDTLL